MHPAPPRRLEADKLRLAAVLATLPDPSPVRLHPSLPQLYRRKVERLESLLADPELAGEASEAIRALITKIVLTPRPEGGLVAVLHGDLAQILTIAEAAQMQEARRVVGGCSGTVPVSRLSVVAGAGFEPATFRL